MDRDFSNCYPPEKSRMHEVCGPGAYFFAFALAARLGGQVIWVQEKWRSEQINPSGFARFISPDKLLLVTTKDQKELMAVSEEALRSTAIAFVVMEASQPLTLTTGRRLQLAARDGETMALAIIPEGMGSNVAETRWHCAPMFDGNFYGADSTLQRWQLIKNKRGTFGVWHVRWNRAAHRVTMVPPTGERAGSSSLSA